MTGIDRVEFAYLREFLNRDDPLFGLVRSSVGFLLLDRPGCRRIAALATDAAALPKADLLSRMIHRSNPTRARAETAARKLAIARVSRVGLARLMRRLPANTGYFNVGHANLTEQTLAQIRRAGLSVTILIHDTIPLDHPAFARAGTVEPFRAKLAAVSAHATCVINITHATRQKTDAQLAQLGRTPPGLVAPIGVDLPQPKASALPADIDLTPPYFVCLGTIEPRKNHALLLDVWDRLPTPAPRLFIIGHRGWADDALFARIDALPKGGPIRILHGLDDGAVAALLSKATALLAPSLAEGFGLPPVEAASLGTPVIAHDLAVTREILGDKAVYLNALDIYSWVETIVKQATPSRPGQSTADPWTAPTWDEHFNTVLRL